MSHPLEAGTYEVAVSSDSGPTNYTIDSRGIGSGRSFTATDLAFSGGSAPITNLAPREAAYFKVHIDANTTRWEVTLQTTTGEMALLVRKGTVPDFLPGGSVDDNTADLKMQKARPERRLRVPRRNTCTARCLPTVRARLFAVSAVIPNEVILSASAPSGLFTLWRALPAGFLDLESIRS